MAYQNVGTPRFYIDYLTYWHSMGYIQDIRVADHHGASLGGDKFFIGLDPASPTTFTISDEGDDTDQMALGVNFPYQQYLPIRVLDSINYMGVLGHDLQEFGMSARAFNRDSADSPLGAHDETGRINNKNIVNAEAPNNETEIINAEYTGLGDSEAQQFNTFNDNGFSLFQVDGYESNANAEGIDRLVFLFRKYGLVGESTNQTFQNIHNDNNPLTGSWNINCITMGHFYDMPISADLKLNMEIEFDGYDQIDTTGGSTLTNVRYTGSPQWGNNNPWEIGDSNPIYKRNGRRTWSMKFSHIADKDLFASNYSSNNWLSNSTDNSDYSSNEDLTIDGNEFEYTLMDDDSFIAKVLNFVGNGQRFIFQADNTNNNPDQFAICVLDQDSLRISQVAFKTYNISLKIREVW